MSTKVLVFESDAAFAGELRNELGKLGCATNVVDDGNAGLQQAASDRPDLILLSIELPRMNGFSVCNKLKKDGRLKDVPLIIMSTESSDETFEQHKKLRTRAEDYVHKPIAFGELLQHINRFVQLGGGPSATDAEGDGIVIDDEISSIDIEEEGTLVVEDGREAVAAAAVRPSPSAPPPAKRASRAPRPPSEPPAKVHVDDDIDAFVEGGFGKMTGTNGSSSLAASSPEAVEQAIKAKSVAPPPPPAPNVDDGRVAELEAELQRAREEAAQLRADFDAKIEAEQKKMDAEMEELRGKLATAGKSGVSSREFLDLREALNKKDKEILGMREQLARKDKEIIEVRERALGFERGKADLEDKLIAAMREVEEAKDKTESLARDKEQAKKASEDFKNRLTKAQTDLEARVGELNDAKTKLATAESDLDARTRELEEMRVKAAEEAASREAATAAARADFESALAKEQAERAAALESAQADKAAALEAAQQKAAAELEAAIASRESELKAESDSKLGALHRAQQEEMGRLRAEHAQENEALASRHASEAALAQAKFEEQLEEAKQEADQRLAAREAELEAKRAEDLRAAEERRAGDMAAVERDRDEKLAAVEGRASERVAAAERDRDEKIAELERTAGERVAALERDRDEKVAAAGRDRDERVAAAERDRDEKLASLEREANERVTALERSRDEMVGMLRAELQKLGEMREAENARSSARISELEQDVGEFVQTKERLERDLATAKDRIVVLEAETAALRTELSDAKNAHARESARAEKAFAKWEADRAALERAKDALAVVLGQIEDAEGRPIT